MTDELRFDGKVAIVTGAGRNLGREYALLLAARGARVVVNDLGVAISDTEDTGDASASDPAADVVAEIAAAGGEAVANRDTSPRPRAARRSSQAALDAWGAVDVVVNNAGQVRMRPFADFPEAHVDTVIATQLRGTLNVSRPAWRSMADGRRRPVRERLVGRRRGGSPAAPSTAWRRRASSASPARWPPRAPPSASPPT